MSNEARFPVHLEDVNIEAFEPMPTPADIKRLVPMTDKAADAVAEGRRTVRRILKGGGLAAARHYGALFCS